MATIPVQHTWSAAEVVTAAQMNSNVRDGINFHNGTTGGKPLVSLRATAVQAIPTNIAPYVPLLLDTTDLDKDAGHSSTDTSKYVSKTAGWYQVNAGSSFSANSNGGRLIALMLNGATVAGSASFVQPVVGGNTVARTAALVYMNVNDYLQVGAYQSSGVTLNTYATGDQTSSLTMVWMSL
jgi:hypothetical protein